MDTLSSTFLFEIASGIRSIEEDIKLYEATNFNSRTDAIDFIDFHIIDRIEGLPKTGTAKELEELKAHALQIKNELEAIDTSLFIQLRDKIRTGIYTNGSFLEMIHEYLGSAIGNIDVTYKIGYDNLDVFMDALLSDQLIPEPILERGGEMVFYQKTPARIIFRMIKMAKLTEGDVFYDIGSGLGQVSILAHLMCGATAKGIEYEPAYCNYAKTCALQLNLSNVTFINGDALDADYADGTVFFLYSPFKGSMLQDMLEILKTESLKRRIRIFTYGPCSLYVAKQGWLNCMNRKVNNHYELYEFRSFYNK